MSETEALQIHQMQELNSVNLNPDEDEEKDIHKQNIDIESEEDEDEDDEDDDDEEFYTPGPDHLFDTRVKIADYSLSKAQNRVQLQYDRFKSYDKIENLKLRRNYYNYLKNSLSLQGTQLISNRFTSSISYSSLNRLLAVTSWNGSCYIVDPLNLSITSEINHLHPEKISGLDWSPTDSSLLATGGSDGIVNLISNPSTPNLRIITPLSGHLARINDIKFHPLGSLLTTASSDLTWRLWDLNKSSELYYQEGHTDFVNSISIHPDGSILASAGNDSIIKLWDLRSGKNILNFDHDGHIKSIHSLDWRSNGYHLASGGADSQLFIWDIRMGRKLANVLAHNKLISSVKFVNDKLLLSTGYDGNLALTATDSWIVFKKFDTLDKIMTCEYFTDDDDNDSSLNIVTGGWDRSIKLYNTFT